MEEMVGRAMKTGLAAFWALVFCVCFGTLFAENAQAIPDLTPYKPLLLQPKAVIGQPLRNNRDKESVLQSCRLSDQL